MLFLPARELVFLCLNFYKNLNNLNVFFTKILKLNLFYLLLKHK